MLCFLLKEQIHNFNLALKLRQYETEDASFAHTMTSSRLKSAYIRTWIQMCKILLFGFISIDLLNILCNSQLLSQYPLAPVHCSAHIRRYHQYNLWLKKTETGQSDLATGYLGYLCELLCRLCLSWRELSGVSLPPLWIHSGSCSVIRFLQDQNLFVLGQNVIEDVEEDVNVVLLENQRWTETDGSVPTSSQKDTCQQQAESQYTSNTLQPTICPPSSSQH